MQYKPEIKHFSGQYLRKPPLTAMPFFYSPDRVGARARNTSMERITNAPVLVAGLSS
jgi:hypothetical protein